MTKLSSFVLVAFIWGITNTLISKASKQKPISKAKINKPLKPEFLNWITNPLYVISVLFNLLGSLLFFYKLANSSKLKVLFSLILHLLEISIAGPLVNSLTLAITALSGNIINKEKLSLNSLLGVILVIFGTCLATI